MAQQVDRSVDEDRLGRLLQPGDGPARRHPEGLGHPPFVALGGSGMPDGPVLAPRRDRVEDLLAPRLAQHLGIPEPRRHRTARHPGAHHGDTDGERTGPGATPDLVEARHALVALGTQAALLLEVGRADGHGITVRRTSYHGGVSADGGEASDPNARSPLSPGTKVDVRNRFQGTWVRGFEIAEVTGDGYRIRRLSDGSTLGELFSRDDVRRERTRQGFWWH